MVLFGWSSAEHGVDVINEVAFHISGGDALAVHEPQLSLARRGVHRHELHQRFAGPSDHHIIPIKGLLHIPGEVCFGVVEIHLHDVNLAGLPAVDTAGGTGWTPDPPLALAPSLSADPADRIIVALDGMAPDQALRFAAQVQGLCWVKVGLELFVQAGPRWWLSCASRPAGVPRPQISRHPGHHGGGCRRAAALGAELITVHACAGSEALQAAQAAAVEGAKQWATRSYPAGGDGAHELEEQRLQRELAIAQGIAERVPALAQLSATAGIGGCVCSPLEAAALRAQHPEPFALVTPGIRPRGAAVGDQARVMGPAEALAAGASQLVIGRPITKQTIPTPRLRSAAGSSEAEVETALHLPGGAPVATPNHHTGAGTRPWRCR